MNAVEAGVAADFWSDGEYEDWATFVEWFHDPGADPDDYYWREGSWWPAQPAEKPEKPKRPTRQLQVTRFIGADDGTAAVGCSRSQAYRHLHRAGAKQDCEGRSLRISIGAWEQYVQTTFS